jgi:hypothetical protein
MTGVLRRLAVLAVLALAVSGCGAGARAPVRASSTQLTTRAAPTSTHTTPAAISRVPRPDHIVIVVLENHSFDEIVGQSDAPFLNSLAATGAVLTRSYAVTHPSEPNYLALFSGSTQGVTSDACPLHFGGGNLARSLLDAGFGFAGYSEDLPSVGYTGCSAGGSYARKHSPWVNFTNVPAALNKPMSAFPRDYSTLPTVSFVIPDLRHDMHDGTLAQADQWLREQLGNYASWAVRHNSLLVVTADEDDYSSDNRIATLVAGAHVKPGRYSEHVDHYRLLRTIEDAYALTPLGMSARTAGISDIWQR